MARLAHFAVHLPIVGTRFGQNRPSPRRPELACGPQALGTIEGRAHLGDAYWPQARNTLPPVVRRLFATLRAHRFPCSVAEHEERSEFLLHPFGSLPCPGFGELSQPVVPLLLLLPPLTGAGKGTGTRERCEALPEPRAIFHERGIAAREFLQRARPVRAMLDRGS
jgi:hypothetical protein